MRWKLAAALLAWHACAAAADFECLIEPAQVVEIRASVEGVITSISVQRGDPVKKGQVLVELQSGSERVALESARYRAQMEGQVASARSRLDYATKKLARLNGLQQQNYASAQDRDEADAEYRLAQSELQVAIDNRELAKIEQRRAQEQLALRRLVSPFSGVVVDRVLNPGDLAESGTGRRPVLKVAQIDPMKVDVVLPAALFGQVKAGQKASVQAEVGGGRYAATVRLVDKVIDAASGTFVARLELPNPKRVVPGGSRCSATIEGISSPRGP
jgi:RND family efflux transporter MFP subunit